MSGFLCWESFYATTALNIALCQSQRCLCLLQGLTGAAKESRQPPSKQPKLTSPQAEGYSSTSSLSAHQQPVHELRPEAKPGHHLPVAQLQPGNYDSALMSLQYACDHAQLHQPFEQPSQDRMYHAQGPDGVKPPADHPRQDAEQNGRDQPESPVSSVDVPGIPWGQFLQRRAADPLQWNSAEQVNHEESHAAATITALLSEPGQVEAGSQSAAHPGQPASTAMNAWVSPEANQSTSRDVYHQPTAHPTQPASISMNAWLSSGGSFHAAHDGLVRREDFPSRACQQLPIDMGPCTSAPESPLQSSSSDPKDASPEMSSNDQAGLPRFDRCQLMQSAHRMHPTNTTQPSTGSLQGHSASPAISEGPAASLAADVPLTGCGTQAEASCKPVHISHPERVSHFPAVLLDLHNGIKTEQEPSLMQPTSLDGEDVPGVCQDAQPERQSDDAVSSPPASVIVIDSSSDDEHAKQRTGHDSDVPDGAAEAAMVYPQIWPDLQIPYLEGSPAASPARGPLPSVPSDSTQCADRAGMRLAALRQRQSGASIEAQETFDRESWSLELSCNMQYLQETSELPNKTLDSQCCI